MNAPDISTSGSKSRIGWGYSPHRDGVKLVILVILLGNIPLQRIRSLLCLILFGVEQRSVFSLVSLHQEEMAVPDKFGSDLVRRRIVGEADLVVCRIGAWDEQLLVRE